MPATLIIPDHIKTFADLEGEQIEVVIEGQEAYIIAFEDTTYNQFPTNNIGASAYIDEYDEAQHLCSAYRTDLPFSLSDKEKFDIAVSQMNRAIIRAREVLKEKKE